MRLVLGPPGTGKTTDLIKVVELELAAGTKSTRIAYISFTKKASEEAKSRAMEKFKLQDSDLPLFRTVHSLVFRQMALNRTQVAQKKDLDELGEIIGVDFSGSNHLEDGSVDSLSYGHKLLFLENLSRVTGKPLEQIWRDSDHGLEWGELEKFQRAYAKFKANRMLVDFTDMLELFISQKPVPSVDVLIIDEAQDLSMLQWRVVELVAKQCKKIYVAGDDDQSLFEWAGSDVDHFISLSGEVKILDQSYRIPKSVHDLALSIVGRIKNRKQKDFKPRKAVGKVETWATIDDVDMSQGKWMLLARNGYLLRPLEQLCLRNGWSYSCRGRGPLDSPSLRAIRLWETLRRNGVCSAGSLFDLAKVLGHNISLAGKNQLSKTDPEMLVDMTRFKEEFGLKTDAIWHEALVGLNQRDRDYFLAARRRGEKLLQEPRININTIHSVKGGEADHVLLVPDMSKTTWEAMQRNPDYEARVWYVAVTRAIESLNIVNPSTNLYFEL